jgi:hypothetical protein
MLGIGAFGHQIETKVSKKWGKERRSRISEVNLDLSPAMVCQGCWVIKIRTHRVADVGSYLKFYQSSLGVF